jgi:AcrR family transcriptional regulator
LEAAIKRFSEASYERVGLRDIAGDAGVDAALAHRAFGSKERLFEEAFAAVATFDDIFASAGQDWGALFAGRLFDDESGQAASHGAALQMFVRSLSCPQARDIFRSFIERDVIAPMAARAGDPAAERATLFAACLVGLTILRDVVAVAPLGDAARDRSEPLVRALLDFCLDAKREPLPPSKREPLPPSP